MNNFPALFYVLGRGEWMRQWAMSDIVNRVHLNGFSAERLKIEIHCLNPSVPSNTSPMIKK